MLGASGYLVIHQSHHLLTCLAHDSSSHESASLFSGRRTFCTPGNEKAVTPNQGQPPSSEPELTGVGESGQTAEPAFHCAQSMFQPFKPLSGDTVLSPVLEMTTTSPTIELL